MTKLEILEETIEFYGSDPSRRSVAYGIGYKDNVCQYYGPDGRQCAAGRCFNPEMEEENIENRSIGFILMTYSDKKVYKPEYQGHPSSFWEKIQNFHDEHDNFNEEGLSQKGKDVAENLRNYYTYNLK